ncbi:hypothetical protein [Sphingomonas sp. BK580]|uniref:hypothetical protein n=1 Tax=Sphingomonas sp. BK580 TaxID=2586972 RepID=UPI001615AA66|nr:hypothetical protein [Sphingomonas sp. BK580]MBB3694754.1 hypothetical protein [Sphingomonas sp. BK580]
MFRLTSKPAVIRLLLLIAAMLVLAALAYGLRIHVVGDPPTRDLGTAGGTATATAAAPRPVPGPTPVLVPTAVAMDPQVTTHGGAARGTGDVPARSAVAATDLP